MQNISPHSTIGVQPNTHCVNAVLDGMIFRVAVYWYFAVVLHVDADVSENADWYVFLFTWSPQNKIYLLIYNFCVYHECLK